MRNDKSSESQKGKNKSNDTSSNSQRIARGKSKKNVVFPVAASRHTMPEGYLADLQEIKERIQTTRLRTVLYANADMIMLYWDIGSAILIKQHKQGWGTRVIDRLSSDIAEAFPDMKGFSPRNLKYMRAFAAAWPDKQIVQEVLAQLTWYQNLALLERLKDSEIRLWYAHKTREYGWSHNILSMQIDLKLFEREGKLVNNFKQSLPPVQSDMAHQIFKDPYVFDFLGTADLRREKELEQGLVDHVQKFLLELGAGFAFVGRQVHLELGDSDFYLDLLFYHLKLRCFVVIELKAGDLDPGHISQLNMYMNVVDDILRHENDNQSIGLLLVKKRNKIIAEYCLQGYSKPIGIAEWESKLKESLPENIKSNLPSIEEIERVLEKDQ